MNPRYPKWKSRVQTNAPRCLKQSFGSTTAANAYVAMESHFNGHLILKNFRIDPSSLDEPLASTGQLLSKLHQPRRELTAVDWESPYLATLRHDLATDQTLIGKITPNNFFMSSKWPLRGFLNLWLFRHLLTCRGPVIASSLFHSHNRHLRA